MKIPPWRLHDLRRSFVTGLAELGIRPDVIELDVNHVSGMRGGIAGVYNRSELLPERALRLSDGLLISRPWYRAGLLRSCLALAGRVMTPVIPSCGAGEIGAHASLRCLGRARF